jgi:hypothetical protein
MEVGFYYLGLLLDSRTTAEFKGMTRSSYIVFFVFFFFLRVFVINVFFHFPPIEESEVM